MYLHGPVKTQGHLQTTHEDIIDKVFVCDANRISSWEDKWSDKAEITTLTLYKRTVFIYTSQISNIA